MCEGQQISSGRTVYGLTCNTEKPGRENTEKRSERTMPTDTAIDEERRQILCRLGISQRDDGYAVENTEAVYGNLPDAITHVMSDWEQQVQDHEHCAADVRRLTRELDVAISGEDGAAKQASLCDLIHPAEALRRDAERYRWLRQHPVGVLNVDWTMWHSEESMDAEVDRRKAQVEISAE